jgi:hypothetical protein
MRSSQICLQFRSSHSVAEEENEAQLPKEDHLIRPLLHFAFDGEEKPATSVADLPASPLGPLICPEATPKKDPPGEVYPRHTTYSEQDVQAIGNRLGTVGQEEDRVKAWGRVKKANETLDEQISELARASERLYKILVLWEVSVT